jgi:hypothetical protein
LASAIGLMSLSAIAGPPPASQALCQVKSKAQRASVVELYTSEGCSSCPPADRWLSAALSAHTALGSGATRDLVVMAYHVSYWDYIGWVDRFATAEFNQRQRDLARRERRSSIYTPQLVRDGADWPRWGGTSPDAFVSPAASAPAARADIVLTRNRAGAFEADVTPHDSNQPWSAYWTATEDGHATKVRAGENRGESLKHDAVVRELQVVSAQRGAARLVFKPAPGEGAHLQRVNLVVSHAGSHELWQAVSAVCHRQL